MIAVTEVAESPGEGLQGVQGVRCRCRSSPRHRGAALLLMNSSEHSLLRDMERLASGSDNEFASTEDNTSHATDPCGISSMPRRTNDFQTLVALIETQLGAEGA